MYIPAKCLIWAGEQQGQYDGLGLYNDGFELSEDSTGWHWRNKPISDQCSSNAVVSNGESTEGSSDNIFECVLIHTFIDLVFLSW